MQKRIREFSSSARELWPKALEMYERGMNWKEIANELKVPRATLFNWRKLAEEQKRGV